MLAVITWPASYSEISLFMFPASRQRDNVVDGFGALLCEALPAYVASRRLGYKIANPRGLHCTRLSPMTMFPCRAVHSKAFNTTARTDEAFGDMTIGAALPGGIPRCSISLSAPLDQSVRNALVIAYCAASINDTPLSQMTLFARLASKVCRETFSGGFTASNDALHRSIIANLAGGGRSRSPHLAVPPVFKAGPTALSVHHP